MTQNELLEKVSAATCGIVKRKDLKDILKQTFFHIRQQLLKGSKITIPEFGTFKIAERKARKGRNPQTGEAIDIPAKKSVKFTPCADLRNIKC